MVCGVGGGACSDAMHRVHPPRLDGNAERMSTRIMLHSRNANDDTDPKKGQSQGWMDNRDSRQTGRDRHCLVLLRLHAVPKVFLSSAQSSYDSTV